MLVLGIDTSAHPGSVALLREEGGALGTLEVAALGAGQPSETLLPAIAALLARHGLDKHSLSLVAVASGPGSFTGLRVSLATAKGLAEALSIPIIAVSVLEAIAPSAPPGPATAPSVAARRVLAALDARRGELFFGEYLVPAGGGLPQKLREGVALYDDFFAQCQAAPSAMAVVTPDRSLAERLREGGVAAELLARPTAEAVARIGYRKFLAGERADVATLDANYLRRSEAELVAASRLGIPPGKD